MQNKDNLWEKFCNSVKNLFNSILSYFRENNQNMAVQTQEIVKNVQDNSEGVNQNQQQVQQLNNEKNQQTNVDKLIEQRKLI